MLKNHRAKMPYFKNFTVKCDVMQKYCCAKMLPWKIFIMQKCHRAKVLPCKSDSLCINDAVEKCPLVLKWRSCNRVLVQNCPVVQKWPSVQKWRRAKVSPHDKVTLVQKWPVPIKNTYTIKSSIDLLKYNR